MAAAAPDYLVDLLAPWGNVRLKRMFGGFGLYRDDVFFSIIDDGVVYFKVDDALRHRFEAAQSEPFSFPHKDKSGEIKQMIMKGYWRVPDEVLEDTDQLFEWAQASYEVALAKPKGKSPARLPGIKGLGAASINRLKEVGISTGKDLTNYGAVEAYKKVKARYPKAVTLNLLWGLYAALHEMDVKQITPDIKAHLIALLEAIPND